MIGKVNQQIQTILEFLLEYAPVNILYRTKREILNEPIDCPEMLALQAKICLLPKVRKAFSCQQESGFFGSVLHGCYYDGFDSTVELLKKNGVELTNPNLMKARDMLSEWKNFESDSFYKAGSAMDEHGRGGFRAVWAELLVELGEEESHPLIQEQVQNALDAFAGALEHHTPDDFSKKATFRGQPCRYYIKGAKFPAANHIKILEKTRSWRTEDQVDMVKRSYSHCKEIMRDYHDGVLYVNCGYFVGPFNHNWNDHNHPISIRDFDDDPINFAWFMKGLGSASVLYPIFDDENPYLVDSLSAMLTDSDFAESIHEEQLRMFKNYASIAPSWRKRESLLCDLYFPMMLALKKAGAL